MMKLHVFDVSAAVHTGTSGYSVEYRGFPVGGIGFLMSYLAVAFAQRESVVLCFDSPSERKNQNDGYKAGREKNPGVYSQIETLFEGLQACGIRCEKYSGYEADDIIEWTVEDNYGTFPGGIDIYYNDYDLCHSVRNGVTLRALRSDMNDIDAVSYETAIYKGKRIAYNTISAYKVFTGCTSDNIPPMHISRGLSGQKLYELWLAVAKKIGPLPNRAVGPNPQIVQAFAEKCGLFTSEEIKDVERRIKLIYPSKRPSNVRIQPVEVHEINMEALSRFCTMYQAKQAMKCLGMKYAELSEEEKRIVYEKGRALKTGEYAADRNLQHATRSVKSKLLSLEAFEKEF